MSIGGSPLGDRKKIQIITLREVPEVTLSPICGGRWPHRLGWHGSRTEVPYVLRRACFTFRSQAARRETRAQDELALETARLKTAVSLGDFIEGNPLGDTWPDGARCQQAEEPLQIPPGTTQDGAPA